GRKRILGLSSWVRKHAAIEERFLAHFGVQMLYRNHLWFFSDRLPSGTGRALGVLRQFTTVPAMLAAAARKMGARASVAVFPHGGVTYRAEPRLALDGSQKLH